MQQDPVTSTPLSRERLTELLGEAEAARVRRSRWQTWAFGVGLTALALGMPLERLWGPMELGQQVAGNGERTAGLVFPAAYALKEAFGLGAEEACFLLAAVCYGLCVPALMGMLRGIGFHHGPAAAGALTALFAPVVWIGSTSPLDFAPGMLGSTLLLWTLFQPRERVRSGYHWRASTTLALAFLLRPENALLFPAVIWAVSIHRGLGRLRGPAAGLTIALTVTFPLFSLFTGDASRAELGWRTLDAVLAGGNGGGADFLRGLAALALGLGASAWGIYVLLLGRRSPEESAAPKWIVPWCLVALAPVVGGTPSYGPMAGFLVPAAAVGIADWLTRIEREDAARRWGVALVLTQVVAVATATLSWRSTDTLSTWRGTVRTVLEPTDVVFGDDPRLLYLARVRWGLESFELDEARTLEETLPGELFGQVRAGDRRLVLVAGPDARLRPPRALSSGALDLRLPVHVLVGGVLEQVAPGEPWPQEPLAPGH